MLCWARLNVHWNERNSAASGPGGPMLKCWPTSNRYENRPGCFARVRLRRFTLTRRDGNKIWKDKLSFSIQSSSFWFHSCVETGFQDVSSLCMAVALCHIFKRSLHGKSASDSKQSNDPMQGVAWATSQSFFQKRFLLCYCCKARHVVSLQVLHLTKTTRNIQLHSTQE